MIRASLFILLVGCGSEETATSDEPRGPRGARPAECDGASDDPEEIDAVFQSAAHYPEVAIERMEAIVGGYAGSATARVRLGELLLRTTPPRTAEARGWFERALDLHERGCTLGHRDLWAAYEYTGHSYAYEDHHDRAIPWLRRALRRWPDIRQSRYNLACALCRTGDLDGCERELHRVISGDAPAPSWLPGRERGPEHYIEVARRDPDLNVLREDSRFDRAIER